MGSQRVLILAERAESGALSRFFGLFEHGRAYEVVHTCAFPYFSLLAAAVLRPLWRYGLVVDWFEVWSRSYWRDYLGGLGGRISR